jgi:voltage-gated potassium channel
MESGAMTEAETTKRALDTERYKLATRIRRGLEPPMTILGLIWLILLILDFTHGLSSALQTVSYVIWGLFVLQFIVEFIVAPKKLVYFRRNWLTAIALVVPAARLLSVFRALRALSALRGIRLVRVVTGVNRGMRALGRILGRRGFAYAAGLSVMVAFAGAAGMYAFEHTSPGTSITGFWSALWWTAMILTTMGTDFFPKTPEGRWLCFLLALYGFAVFGYLTATISSYFIARDADTDDGDVAGAKQLKRLEQQIERLQELLDAQRTNSAS